MYEFQRVYHRRPTTWRDFQWGIGHAGRAAFGAKLQHFDAVNAAGALQEDKKRWVDSTKRAAGV